MDPVIGRDTSNALSYNGKLMSFHYAREADMKFTAWVSGENIWSDGVDIYHSLGSNTSPSQHLLFEKQNGRWTETSFSGSGLDYFDAMYVWHDYLGNTYYDNKASSPTVHKKFNRATHSWDSVSYTGTSPDGRYVWNDGVHTYYSNDSAQYIFDASTLSWTQKTWNIGNIDPSHIWSDDGHIYYWDTSATDTYELDIPNGEWVSSSVVSCRSGIWNDHLGNTYSTYTTSNPSVLHQKKFDRSTGTWIDQTWYGLTVEDSKHIWSDGENTYYSYGSKQYSLDVNTSTWTIVSYLSPYRGLSPDHIFEYNGDSYFNAYYRGTVPTLRETGPISYKLNTSTNTWEAYEWNVYPIVGVWHHNGKTYGTLLKGTGDRPYYLDDLTLEWKPMTWNGLPYAYEPYERGIWKDSDGTVYYSDVHDSNISDQYKLVGSNTWQQVTWNINYLNATKVWHEGNNTYYSNGTGKQYYLDTGEMKWFPKTWHFDVGSDYAFDGEDIWEHNSKMYYSNPTRSITLTVPNSTWVRMFWNGIGAFYGSSIWVSPDDKCYLLVINQLPIELK